MQGQEDGVSSGGQGVYIEGYIGEMPLSPYSVYNRRGLLARDGYFHSLPQTGQGYDLLLAKVLDALYLYASHDIFAGMRIVHHQRGLVLLCMAGKY